MLNLIPKPLEINFYDEKKLLVKESISFNLDNYFEYASSLATLIEDKSLAEDEYIIDINDSIKITYASSLGLFYASISLNQLIFNYSSSLPHLKILDKPRFKYRGFMFDVGRYFFSVDEIKRLMDLCAFHKINKFHIHLTEDQGWRIQIDKYPLLTEIGSKRTRTNYHFSSHKGYYTKEDIKELVSYSKKRFIELIPEIDIPGHSMAALAAYKELGCFNRNLKVATTFGVKHDILCAGKEFTYEFEKDVLREVMDLFDCDYIHIGGDEAPKTRWEICPNCQKKIKELNLKDENALQAYFVNYMASYIKESNKKTITWNEYEPTNNLDKDIIWQVWDVGDNKEKIANSCINSNRPIIYSILHDAYLDLPCALTPIENCYNLPSLDAFSKANVLGVETALWSEFVPNMKTALKRALPRLSAIAESMWTSEENKNYEEYLQKLPSYIDFINSKGYKGCSKSCYFPSNARKILQKIWFERRQLTWHGLYNLVDNYLVKKTYGPKK